jgi:hypothetical protein
MSTFLAKLESTVADGGSIGLKKFGGVASTVHAFRKQKENYLLCLATLCSAFSLWSPTTIWSGLQHRLLSQVWHIIPSTRSPCCITQATRCAGRNLVLFPVTFILFINRPYPLSFCGSILAVQFKQPFESSWRWLSNLSISSGVNHVLYTGFGTGIIYPQKIKKSPSILEMIPGLMLLSY